MVPRLACTLKSTRRASSLFDLPSKGYAGWDTRTWTLCSANRNMISYVCRVQLCTWLSQSLCTHLRRVGSLQNVNHVCKGKALIDGTNGLYRCAHTTTPQQAQRVSLITSRFAAHCRSALLDLHTPSGGICRLYFQNPLL